MERTTILKGLSILFTGGLFGAGIYGLCAFETTPLMWIWTAGTGSAFGANLYHLWKGWS